jgi:hypothetical protein
MGTTATPVQNQAESLSTVERLANVFFAPSKTFNDLNRDNSWWPAWLLVSVFAFLFMFSVQQKVGFEQITRNEIAASAKTQEAMEKLSPEAREQRIQMSVGITKGISYAFPLTILISGGLIAAVLMATFNFGLGTEMSFNTVLAVLFYAWVPGILKSILAAVSLFAGADPEGFNIRNPAATNIGFFFTRVDHPVLHSMFSWVDVFAIWYIILLGIGFSCVTKVKRSTATSVIAGWYIICAIVGTGWVALFS